MNEMIVSTFRWNPLTLERHLLLFRPFDLLHPLHPLVMIKLHRRPITTHRLQTSLLQKFEPLAPPSSALSALIDTYPKERPQTPHRKPRAFPPNRSATLPAEETRKPIPIVGPLRI